MSAKSRRPPAKKVAPAIAELDDMNVPGAAGGLPSEDVALVLPRDGGPAIVTPASFDRLGPDARDLAGQLMRLVGQRRMLAREIDALVEHMREHRISWVVIGWCVGTTAEAARQRWGLPATQGESP
jgi:hypothetical protein